MCKNIALIVMVLICTSPAMADWTEARCDIYETGSDLNAKMIPCTFSQRQGYITINRDDGVDHELSPIEDNPNQYLDMENNPVTRELIPNAEGMIFRFAQESVYVYWNTSALSNDSDSENNPTYPYSTDAFDATTLIKCGKVDTPLGFCPAGILRMDNKQASIVITSPGGQEFTINFMTNYINATNREVNATLLEDTWIIDVDNSERYEIPIAAIEGG